MTDLENAVAAALQLARACDDLTMLLLHAETREEYAALRATALGTFEELQRRMDTAFQSIHNQVDLLEMDRLDRGQC